MSNAFDKGEWITARPKRSRPATMEGVSTMGEARSVAPVPKEPPPNGGLSGPALDDIAERLVNAAKKGTPVRLADVQALIVHMHSTEAYEALRQSAYTNNALGLQLLAENRTLREALKGVVAVADRNTVEFENARAALASNGTASAQAPEDHR